MRRVFRSLRSFNYRVWAAGALVSNIDMGPAALPMSPRDSTVAFLPSAHIAQRVVIELLPLRSGMPLEVPVGRIQILPDAN